MKLPYHTVLVGMAGEPMIKTPEAKNEKGEIVPAVPLTLKDVLLTAFSVAHKDDDSLKAADKYAMGKLGYDIGKEADLTVDEVAKVKERVGQVMIPSYVFPVWNLIEGAAKAGEVQA